MLYSNNSVKNHKFLYSQGLGQPPLNINSGINNDFVLHSFNKYVCYCLGLN
jgi:hypothetical protein